MHEGVGCGVKDTGVQVLVLYYMGFLTLEVFLNVPGTQCPQLENQDNHTYMPPGLLQR